ncbi:MAG: peptidoglycan-binding protein [Nitrospirales bacterium]
MRRPHVQGFRGSIILAAVMALGLTGCDYWPPALLAQLEQLRNHVQDLSDERARLDAQLRESAVGKDDLQAKLQELSRKNQTLRDRIARLERTTTSQRRKLAVASKSMSSTSIARTPSRARAARVLAMQQPPMKGKDVKTVQRGLKRIGVPVDLDGVYGVDTRAAVRWFQRKHDLRVDGVVGPGTRSAIEREAARQNHVRVVRLRQPIMQGADVKMIQKALRHAGLSVRVDGAFGSRTRDAVKSFQRELGLRADGVVGPATRSALGLS